MTEPNAAETAEAKIAEREGGADSGAPARGQGQAGKKRGPYKKSGRVGVAKAAAPAKEPEPITEGEIEIFAMLGGTIWSIVARFTDMEGLTPEETYKLGAAMAPVARKYIPSLDEYAPEATLIIMVGGLVIAKRRKKPKPEEGAADLEIPANNGTEEPK